MKLISALLAISLCIGLTGCTSEDSGDGVSDSDMSTDYSNSAQVTDNANDSNEQSEVIMQNALGSLTPDEALEYMKSTDNLIIVDVATESHYSRIHFEGAISIPIENISNEAADALYMEIPAGYPVILHCRQGVIVPGAYRHLMELRTDIPEISYIAGAPLFDEYNEWKSGQSNEQELLGGIAPTDALEYMKSTPDLVIVEVNAPEWKLSTGFNGALYIPYTEMAERYDEIPKDRPILLHCGGGIVSVEAYEILQEKRPDIPQLGYIAGSPPVRAYNEWLENQ